MTDTHITTAQQLIELADLATHLPSLLTSHSRPEAGSRNAGAAIAHSPAPARLDILHALDTRIRDNSDDAETRAWHDRQDGPTYIDGMGRATRAGADHRQGLIPDLYQWCKLVDGEARNAGLTPTDLPDPVTLTGVTGWLHRHLDWALTQPWSRDLARDIDWWWRRVRHLTGERDPYQPRCTFCLFPYLEVEGGWWKCQGCGTEKSIDTGLKQIAQPLVTISQAAALTGTPRGTLKQWAADGRIIPIGNTTPAIYRLGDLLAVADTPPRRGRPPQTTPAPS